MTLYQFQLSDEMEQIEAFWGGILVGERKEEEFTIECRQIDDFYVEYKKQGKHYVDMRYFRNPDLLKPYFDQMDNISKILGDQ
jgi:hypothetical protein